MPVNMLLLACEIITLKRNLNYTADRAVRKWLSEYIALICECRHRLRCLCFIYCNRVSFEKEEAKTTSEEIRPRCFTVSLSFTLSTSACCCPAESLVRSFVLLQSELNILSWSFLKQRWCCSWLKYASRQQELQPQTQSPQSALVKLGSFAPGFLMKYLPPLHGFIKEIFSVESFTEQDVLFFFFFALHCFWLVQHGTFADVRILSDSSNFTERSTNKGWWVFLFVFFFPQLVD